MNEQRERLYHMKPASMRSKGCPPGSTRNNIDITVYHVLEAFGGYPLYWPELDHDLWSVTEGTKMKIAVGTTANKSHWHNIDKGIEETMKYETCLHTHTHIHTHTHTHTPTHPRTTHTHANTHTHMHTHTHTHMHTHAPAHTHTHTHTHTHMHTHARTHTHTCARAHTHTHCILHNAGVLYTETYVSLSGQHVLDYRVKWCIIFASSLISC